jgi:membrane-bound lytic murein transglycosylase A
LIRTRRSIQSIMLSLFHRPRRLQHYPLAWKSWIVSLFILVVTGCAPHQPVTTLSVGQHPLFLDDASPADLIQAIERQIEYLENIGQEGETIIDRHRFSVSDLLDSLRSFKEIVRVETDPLRRGQLIREHFHVFQASGRTDQRQMLVTGYFEPLYAASLVKQAPYLYPIYRKPDSLIIRPSQQSGPREIGRLDRDGTFLPYWTRQELESGNLLCGFELAYLRDPLDAYLLQVQGSGRLQLPDGSIRAVQFAASNGLVYNSLGKLFVDQGIMPRQQVSVPAIRAYFAKHPYEISSMLHHNPRFIFFDWGDTLGPQGSLGVPLTPGRSVAIDHHALPTGVVGYLLTQRPVLDGQGRISHWRPFGRFVVPQDSGAAIKGPGRVDLFWGAGDYAETAAGHMNHQGALFFLVKKNDTVFDSPQ